MRRRQRFKVVGPVRFLAVAAIGILACGGVAAASSTTAPSRALSVPIGVAYTAESTIPIVAIHVVGGPLLHLELDTQSSGVEIFQTRLASMAGFTPSVSAINSLTFADGTTLYGSAALMRYRLGGAGPPSAVLPVRLVSSVVCPTVAPCAAASLEAGHGAYGADGIFGIDPDPQHGYLPNPLRYLPAPYDRYWTVAIGASGIGGRLSVGPPAPDPGERILPMARVGDSGWDSAIHGCWRIDGSRPWCVATYLDTGSSGVVLYGHPPGLNTVPIPTSGTRAATPDQTWTFYAGGKNVVVAGSTDEEEFGGYGVLVENQSAQYAIIGVHALGGVILTFDLTDGVIGIAGGGVGE